MLEAAVTSARHRPWRIIALLALVLAALAGFVLALFVLTPDSDGQTVVPIVVRTPPAPEPAAIEPIVDEPIEYLAAASDAPVIAVGSAHHVWISRDDGETFAPALQDPRAELYDLSTDPTGRVYAMWGEDKNWRSPGGGGVDTIEFALGIAELDGHERWRAMNEMVAAPLDARAGWIVGTGVPMIGRDFGDTWKRPPSSDRWHVWRASVDDQHTVRLLTTQLDAPDCEDCGRGLSLLVSRDGGRLERKWSMLNRTEIMTDDFPTMYLECAGFAGPTLYLVAREPKGPRLIAVGGDGKVIPKDSLAKDLPADVTCAIAGNDRAAYMALGDDVVRIDTDELRVGANRLSAKERDILAVDEHGHLLYVADACVWRYTEGGSRLDDKVVCGPHR